MAQRHGRLSIADANLAVITNVLLIAFSSTALAEPLVSAGAEPVTIYKSIDERYGSFYLW